MRVIAYLHEREPILSLLEISRVVSLSYSCVKNVVKKSHESEASEIWEFAIEKKGRKEKITGEMAQLVKAHLTESRTSSLSTAKQHLENLGILLSKTSVWRLAHMGGLSFKRTALKGEVTLTERIIESRFFYATRITRFPMKCSYTSTKRASICTWE